MTETKKSGGGTDRLPDKRSTGHTRYLYWTRIAKGCVLPILYTIVSILMLRNYVLEFPNYYDYKPLFIAAGAALGLLTMTGMTVLNIFRARKQVKTGAKLDSWVILAMFLPVLIVIVVLALVFGPSTVWQFSIGYFATTVVPPVLVLLIELLTRSKFYIDEADRPVKAKRLFMVPNETG